MKNWQTHTSVWKRAEVTESHSCETIQSQQSQQTLTHWTTPVLWDKCQHKRIRQWIGMDVEIGIRNDWNTLTLPSNLNHPFYPSQWEASVIKPCQGCPQLHGAWSCVHGHTGSHQLLLSCTRSRWFAPGRARLHRVCTYSRQSVPVRTRSAPGHSRSGSTPSRASPCPSARGLTISLMSWWTTTVSLTSWWTTWRWSV